MLRVMLAFAFQNWILSHALIILLLSTCKSVYMIVSYVQTQLGVTQLYLNGQTFMWTMQWILLQAVVIVSPVTHCIWPQNAFLIIIMCTAKVLHKQPQRHCKMLQCKSGNKNTVVHMQWMKFTDDKYLPEQLSGCAPMPWHKETPWKVSAFPSLFLPLKISSCAEYGIGGAAHPSNFGSDVCIHKSSLPLLPHGTIAQSLGLGKLLDRAQTSSFPHGLPDAPKPPF